MSLKNRLIWLVIYFMLMFSVQVMAKVNADPKDLIPFKVILPEGEKYGAISMSTGKWAINPSFEQINYFNKETGLAAVKINGKYGFINSDGKVIIPPRFDEVGGIWSEGLCSVKIDGNTAFINRSGEMVIAPQPYKCSFFSEGLALIWINHKAGFIDKTGSLVIPAKYRYFVGSFKDGLASVEIGRNMGFINKNGEVVIEPRFENWDCSFSEGLAAVQIRGKYGFIDRTGQMVIEPQYDFAGPFREDVAAVMQNGKIGFIDKTGQVVIDLKYEYPDGWQPQIAFGSGYLFHSGIASVRWNGKYGCIDKAGNWVVQPVFEQLAPSYIAKQKIVIANGFFYDVNGKKLDLYANHMLDGYLNLKKKDADKAIASFEAALKLIPRDEAAKYGILQGKALKIYQ